MIAYHTEANTSGILIIKYSWSNHDDDDDVLFIIYIFYFFSNYFKKIMIEEVQMNSIVDLFQIIFISISSRFLTSWQQRHYVDSLLDQKNRALQCQWLYFPTHIIVNVINFWNFCRKHWLMSQVSSISLHFMTRKKSSCCFSAKQISLRSKNKYWLARNQDNMSE